MGYLDSLNITGSALTAERFRTDIILQNLANQNTTRTAEGGPYRRARILSFRCTIRIIHTPMRTGMS